MGEALKVRWQLLVVLSSCAAKNKATLVKLFKESYISFPLVTSD